MEQTGQARYAPLPPDTNLHHRYTVREIAAQTDYETVYRGFDYVARQEVSIREFFPRSLAVRGAGSPAVSPRFRSLGALFFLSSEAYVRQYGTLTQAIGSPNLVSVFESFFENGAGYAVTERLSGVALEEYLLLKDRLLTPGEAVYVAQAASDALLVVHSLSVLHHDIAMDTIFICTDGTVKLADFGAGKRTVRTRHEVDDTLPSSDIHALGAALYRAVTGRTPPDKPPLPAAPSLPASLFDMLERMLSPDPALRFQSVFDLRYAAYALDIPTKAPSVTEAELAAWREKAREKAVQTAPEEKASPSAGPEGGCPKRTGEDRPGPASRRTLFVVCGVLLALLAALAAALWLRFQ